jgi:ABC-2 type transport system permease protein
VSLRLFWHIVSVEARTRMSYRVDFWINSVVGFLAHFGLMYFLWNAMFAESGQESIGGYDFPTMLFYFVAVILIGKIVRGPELTGAVSTDIYEGGLNRYLVFPTSYFLFKYAQNLGALLPALVQLALFGIWFLFILELPPDVSLTPLTVVMGLIAAFVANLLYFVMLFPLQCVAFWADNVWSLSVALRFVSGILGGAMLPLSVFPIWGRELLTWLPFRYLYDFPVNVVLGNVSVGEWALGLGLALAWTSVIGLVGRAVWQRGELQYSGIGI